MPIHTKSWPDEVTSKVHPWFWQKKLEMVSLAWFQWHESTTSSNWTNPHPVTSHLNHMNSHVSFEPHKSDQNQWIEPQNSTTLILAVNTNASNLSRSQHLRRRRGASVNTILDQNWRQHSLHYSKSTVETGRGKNTCSFSSFLDTCWQKNDFRWVLTKILWILNFMCKLEQFWLCGIQFSVLRPPILAVIFIFPQSWLPYPTHHRPSMQRAQPSKTSAEINPR